MGAVELDAMFGRGTGHDISNSRWNGNGSRQAVNVERSQDGLREFWCRRPPFADTTLRNWARPGLRISARWPQSAAGPPWQAPPPRGPPRWEPKRVERQ